MAYYDVIFNRAVAAPLNNEGEHAKAIISRTKKPEKNKTENEF